MVGRLLGRILDESHICMSSKWHFRGGMNVQAFPCGDDDDDGTTQCALGTINSSLGMRNHSNSRDVFMMSTSLHVTNARLESKSMVSLQM